MPAPSTHAFSEKVALITEGTTPIGRAVALQLALYGAYVVVAHPESDSAVSDIEELKSLGTLAESVGFSSRGERGAKEIIGLVEKLYGRLDILVNCPLVEGTCAYQDISEGYFSEVLEKGLESTFFNIKESIQLMADRPKPKIVNIFSACDGDSSKDPAVRAANAAIKEVTVSMSEELPDKFQVNGISISEKLEGKKTAEHLDPELFRPKPAVEPDDVARSALFLLSSESSGIRGQILSLGL